MGDDYPCPECGYAMNLYEITNGFTGESYVRCLVVAENKERAIELAKPEFEKEDERYKGRYSKNLEAELVFKDLTAEHVREARDY